MSGRIALVTGAGGGLGRAAALELAGRGMAVACAYATNDAGAKETAELIEERGGAAQAFGADVADEAQVRNLFAEVKEWRGAPLVLVANAGVRRDGPTVKYPLEQWQRTLDVNLTGVFLCVREALRGMQLARWGRVILVSSAAGLRGNPGQASYSASKAGVLGLTRSLSREVGARGITVNAVAPGYVETAIVAEMTEAARERMMGLIATGRPGRPEEIAAAIGFLASEEASYVTGAVLPVDGGMTA
ncbi:MAG TPA: 3-oxoacyl-ACP reductase family protein [Actinomycetota bacterium]